MTRADIVAYARTLIGTPFHHRERQPGRAIDCAGVLICTMRHFGIYPPDWDVPDYTLNPNGSMLPLCRKHLIEIPGKAMQAGDAVVLIPDEEPQHLGILAPYRYGGLSIIHASSARSTIPPRVIETRLLFARGMRFSAAFSFPGVQ